MDEEKIRAIIRAEIDSSNTIELIIKTSEIHNQSISDLQNRVITLEQRLDDIAQKINGLK